MKKIAILGSTGSIGTQALDIIDQNPEEFSVELLSCSKRIDLLCEQIEAFKPAAVAVERQEDAEMLQAKYPKIEVFYGADGLIEGASGDYDILLNSLVGIRGLAPTYQAVKLGRDIALANKESLVAGGQLVMDAVKEYGARLLPVDSEHSAIFQCLQGNHEKDLRRIILTASGGPFRGRSLAELEHVTLQQALNHPKWNMGSKITIDSATMMNKGLEVIEAKWLFDVPLDRIQIAVHPQSIVHSAVEYCDGSVIAQMGQPDMRTPISYAFGYPRRIQNDFQPLNWFEEGASLTFEKPNPAVFKGIKLSYEASEMGGSYPVVLNGANEVLVQCFLEERISFIDIQNKLEKVLNLHQPKYNLDLEEILEIDKTARQEVYALI